MSRTSSPPAEPDKLDRLMKRGEASARQQYRADPKASLPPTFVALTGADEVLIIVTPWRSNAEKELVHLALPRLFRERDVRAYAHVCEAWSPPDSPSAFQIECSRHAVWLAGLRHRKLNEECSRPKIGGHFEAAKILRPRQLRKSSCLGFDCGGIVLRHCVNPQT